MKKRKLGKAAIALILVLCLIFQTGSFVFAEGADSRVNLALYKSVTANSDVGNQYFAIPYLTNGTQNHPDGTMDYGYSSVAFGSQDLSANPNVITIDLGKECVFDELTLYPRDDVASVTGGSPNFPVDFVVSVSGDNQSFTDVLTIKDNPDPKGNALSLDFEQQTARYVRMTTTRVTDSAEGDPNHYVQLNEMEVWGDKAANSEEDGPLSTTDNRVYIENGQLVIPSGSAVSYQTAQSFSGDYTIEMRACVSNQAVGLTFGSGSPNPPLWILALVEPYGLWAHQPGNWTAIDKVACPDVAQDTPVDMKIEVSGTTVTTSINGNVVHTCTLSASATTGPLGLRFSDTESGKIDYIRVIQNGSTIFEDNFDFIDGDKWNFPVPVEPVYDTNLALNRPVSASSDVNMPHYFRQQYLTDGVVNCADPNFGYSSKGYGSDDISSDPVTVTVDLGQDYLFNQLVLYPRNDVSTGIEGASSPNFMVDFTVQVSSDGVNYTDVYSIVDNPNPNGNAQGHAFEEVTARYVKIVTTKLGPLPTGEFTHYLQFAELEIYNRPNLALNQPVVANSDVNMPVYFQQAYLTDGKRVCEGEAHTGQQGNFGYASAAYGSQDLSSNPVVVAVDLGEVQTVNQIVLYPYDDDTTLEGTAGNFPTVFDIEVSTDGVTFTKALSVTDGASDSVDHGYLYPFEDMEAKWVRIVVYEVSGRFTGNQTASYVNLVEFEVYNRAAVPPNPAETVQRNFYNLPYANNSATQLLDIQLPSTGEGPYPVVVFYHGGAWLIGDKTDAESRGILNTALSKGYAVVNVNYRLASEAQWPAQIYDCKAAVRYIRANAEQYNFDPDRIVALGASAGGHLAQMMGVTNGLASMEDLSMGNADYSSDVQGVVSLYGISDLTKWDMRESLFPTLGDPIERLLGAGYTEEDALAASPITYVSEDTVPFLIAHGQNDNLVEPEHSYTLEAKLKALIGDENVDTYYPVNGPHGDANFWNTQEPIDHVMTFLQKQFEPHKPLTNGDNFRAYDSVDLSSYPNSTLNLQYANDSATQKLHIITPSEGEAPYPTIVFVHGGGFAGGNSSNGSAIYTARGPLQALERGYAVALVDYRCGNEAKYPAPVYDIKAAIRYLRANASTYQLDTERFAIWGESAGGHLADFVALTSGDPDYEDLSMGNAEYSSEIQAAVSWYAITNLTTARNQQYAPTLLGYGASDNFEGALDASPISHVSKDVCPFFIQHGLADDEVEYQDSIQLYDLIVEAAGEDRAELVLFPGINHAVKKFLDPENVNRIVDWLDEQMPVPETDIIFGEDTPSEVYANEYFPVTITTPNDVDRIRLYNENGMPLGMRELTVTDHSDGTRTFSFHIAIGTVGDGRTLTVHTYAGERETITHAKMTIDVKSHAPEIFSADFTEEVGVINGDVHVRVVTDQATTKVNLYNEYGLKIGIVSSTFEDTKEGRVWDVVVRFETDGTRSLLAEAQNKYGAKSDRLKTSCPIKIVVMILD